MAAKKAAEKPAEPQEAAPEPEVQAEEINIESVDDECTIRYIDGWVGIETPDGWEVSVDPAANVHLPRYLVPDDIDDFVLAVTRAAKIAKAIKNNNVWREKFAEPGLPVDQPIITEGPPPEGATRMGIIPRG